MCISKSRPPEQETLAADSTQTKGELLSEENQSAVPVEANSEKSFGPAGSSDPESAGQRFRELITCKCGKKHKLDSSFLGKKVRCKRCGAIFKISRSLGQREEQNSVTVLSNTARERPQSVAQPPSPVALPKPAAERATVGDGQFPDGNHVSVPRSASSVVTSPQQAPLIFAVASENEPDDVVDDSAIRSIRTSDQSKIAMRPRQPHRFMVLFAISIAMIGASFFLGYVFGARGASSEPNRSALLAGDSVGYKENAVAVGQAVDAGTLAAEAFSGHPSSQEQEVLPDQLGGDALQDPVDKPLADAQKNVVTLKIGPSTNRIDDQHDAAALNLLAKETTEQHQQVAIDQDPPNDQDQSPDVASLIHDGRLKLADHRLTNAVESLNKALNAALKASSEAQHATLPDIHWYRAAAHTRLGDLDKAKSDYLDLVKTLESRQGELEAEGLRRLAVAHMKTSARDRAITLLDRAIAEWNASDGQDEVDTMVALLIDRALWHETAVPPDPSKAREDYLAASNWDADSIDARLGVGRATLQLGDIDAGNQSQTHAVRLLAKSSATVASSESLAAGIGRELPRGAREIRQLALEFCGRADRTLLLVDQKTSEEFNFVYVPPGYYRIGYLQKQRIEACRAASDPAFAYNASDSHLIRLAVGFFILDREATTGQWNAIMATRPDAASSNAPESAEPTLPIANVSWTDASVFCHRLSERFGVVVRLPAEVEWECAARASGEWVYPWGTTEFHANAGADSQGTPWQLTSDHKDVTPSGVYDMGGNLSEWCYDEYLNSLFRRETINIVWHPVNDITLPKFQANSSGGLVLVDDQGRQTENKIARTYRGGAYTDSPHLCQIPVRRNEWHTAESPTIGFRPVLVPGAPVDPRR